MKTHSTSTIHGSLARARSARLCAALGVLALVAGCGSPVPEFKTNDVYQLRQELDSGIKVGDRKDDVVDALTALFGTPNEPHLPTLSDVDPKTVLDANLLAMAAGPVGSDKQGNPRGLYREHCAHCHGVTGDGQGPTAEFLNPYPRDYRMGKYKFKSTAATDDYPSPRPTHEDLRKILVNGIPGTAMPSFKVLPAVEIDALVHYVKYLSIRGEVERALYAAVCTELEEETSPLIDVALRDSKDLEKQTQYVAQLDLIKSKVTTSFSAWGDAAKNVTAVPKKPEGMDKEKSIARGREIFYTLANCNKCHGDSALGDGQTTDYDDWTKEYAVNKAQLGQFLAAGALPPRNIIPRNLRQGIYRGGRSPVDIYWRIMNGIEGSPMPNFAASVLKEGEAPDPKKLTQEDVWHLIEYVRNLPYEPISQPQGVDPAFQRDRN